jgi:hypothetical protein
MTCGIPRTQLTKGGSACEEHRCRRLFRSALAEAVARRKPHSTRRKVMKRFYGLVVVGAVLAAAMVGASAGAETAKRGPSVAVAAPPSSQIAALKRQVAKLTAEVRRLRAAPPTRLSCRRESRRRWREPKLQMTVSSRWSRRRQPATCSARLASRLPREEWGSTSSTTTPCGTPSSIRRSRRSSPTRPVPAAPCSSSAPSTGGRTPIRT